MDMDMDTDSQQLKELVSFADEIGLFYEDIGLPRAWGRVLGWLLVCEPDSQSAEDLAAVLHASRGSISMATRTLIHMGSVERHTKPGDRRTYYRIRPGTWTAVFEQQYRPPPSCASWQSRALSCSTTSRPHGETASRSYTT